MGCECINAFTALKWLEMRTFTGTLASITVTSVSVLIFDAVFPDITSNLWLDLASGAVLLGLGIGLYTNIKFRTEDSEPLL